MHSIPFIVISVYLFESSANSYYATPEYFPSGRYYQEELNEGRLFRQRNYDIHSGPIPYGHHYSVFKKHSRNNLKTQDANPKYVRRFRKKRLDLENEGSAINMTEKPTDLTDEKPINMKGRGFLKAISNTHENVWSSLFGLNPIAAVSNLIGGTLEAVSEAGGVTGRLIGGIQKSFSEIIADELNDLSEPEKNSINFLLFTQKNHLDPQQLNHAGDVENTNFDKTKGLTMLIHGFSPLKSPIFDIIGLNKDVSTRTRIVLSVLTLKHAYLDRQSEDNIIIVDWTAISGTINYFSASAATKAVGKVIHQFLLNLLEKGNIDPATVHIIGFSLGAQVSGTAGRLFHEKAGDKIGRITGLDPAGPGFDLVLSKLVGSSTAPEDLRGMLDKGDAKFVDIIHSNAKLGGLGMVSNTGHANFFPNGGDVQPGCSGLPDDAVNGCSHSRAWQLYAESVGTKKYPACKCGSLKDFKKGKCKCSANDTVYMGDLCESKIRGIYYLEAKLGSSYEGPFIEKCKIQEQRMYANIIENNITETTEATLE